MDALSCAEARELAPELALGVLAGSDRAAVLGHLATCARCRALVGELGEAADALTALAPEAEPPPGFEDGVLATLTRRRRRSTRRVLAVVAATAAAATILSIAVVRVVDRGRDDAGEVAASEVEPVRMVGSGGVDVGWAFVSDGEPASVGVSVSYGIPHGRYEVQLRTRGAEAVTIGRLEIVDGQGAWAGTVSLPAGGAQSIALVGADGQIVCEGALSG